MAPKEAFKVHSLSQHIANTNKGISADQQFNRKPTASGTVKKEAQNPNAVFGNNDDSDDDDSSSESESESDAEDTTGFLAKINNKRQASSAAPKPKDKADAKAKTNGQAKAAEKSSSSSSDASTSDEESEAEDKKKTSAKVAKDESSSEEESESESESEEEAPKKAAAAKESSSEEESSSDEESDDDDTTAKNASAVQARSKITEAESSSDESEDEEDAAAGVDESMHMSDREDKGQVTKAKYFGNDFMMHRGDDGLKGKDLDKLCDQARQEGKQIWYFTVPADVPVSVIEKMTVPLSGQDQNVFTHNGDSFAASFETMLPRTDISINIPSKSTIRGGARNADRVMHVKRVTNFSNATVTAPSQGRPARPQPHGLKARFQPMGVQSSMGSIGADSDEEREVEMTDAPALPASPPTSSAKKSSKSSSKRRNSTAEGESSKKQKTKDDAPSSNKKSKKSKTAVEASPAPAPATVEARSTPVPLPPRLGAVPATKVPVPPVSSGGLPGTPTPKNGKKESRSKKKSETPVLPPTSSQASTVPKKVTPVPAPPIPGR